MTTRTNADVLIIGGGHNGLVCAAYLAATGLKVRVLERRHIVGGAAVTEEFHPGFRNSVASYTVSLLNPQKIIWGGGVFGPAGIFIDDIYKEACKWAQPLSIKQVEFVPSQLSGNAGLIGAAFLAIKNHLYE